MIPFWKRDQLAREGVGGYWDTMGNEVLKSLKAWGLRPDHTLLDVGCGSLRVGHVLDEYLSGGNYIGIDINKDFIDYAKRHYPDVPVELVPKGCVIDMQDQFDVALAVSVFTHSWYDDSAALQETMLFNSKAQVATFFVSDSEFPVYRPNPRVKTYPIETAGKENYHTGLWWLRNSGYKHLIPFENPRGQRMFASQKELP